MFCDEMLELFQKIPVNLTKRVYYIKKRQMLLTYIGGKWFMDKYKLTTPPAEKPILSKESQKKESYIKKLQKYYQHLNYWKF